MTSQLLNAAIVHYRAGRMAESITAWSEIIEHERNNWLAWYYLGMSYRKSGMEDEACRILTLVAALSPDARLRACASKALPSEDPDFTTAMAFEQSTAAVAG